MPARVLGAAIDGTPELQGELMSLLRCQEEGQYLSHLTDLRYGVVEALLHHVHKDYGARLSVGTITKTVNAILLGRGDSTGRDPREIGAKLKTRQRSLQSSISRRGRLFAKKDPVPVRHTRDFPAGSESMPSSAPVICGPVRRGG